MKRRVLCVLVLALATAPAAAASLPPHGVLVAGRSLGRISLGLSPADVRARLGRGYGVCDGCAEPTWYFNYAPFTQPGLGVQFRRGRVDAVFTIWQPQGWRSDRGVRLRTTATKAFAAYRGLVSVACSGYSALVLRGRASTTIFYVVGNRLWGFGLQRPGLPTCR